MPCLMEPTSPRSNERFTSEPYTSEETIVHSGIIELASVKGSPKVFVVIHRTSTEHFVVFYPLRLIASTRKPISTINLRSSLVTSPEPDLITIRPRKDIDGASLTLRIINSSSSPETINKWISALSSDYWFSVYHNNNNNNHNDSKTITDNGSDLTSNSHLLNIKSKHVNLLTSSIVGYRHRYMPGAGNCNPVRFGSQHLPPLVESIED